MDDRTLTDADIKALADELEERLANRFYSHLGKGIWGVAWKVIIVGICTLAAYGYYKGH